MVQRSPGGRGPAGGKGGVRKVDKGGATFRAVFPSPAAIFVRSSLWGSSRRIGPRFKTVAHRGCAFVAFFGVICGGRGETKREIFGSPAEGGERAGGRRGPTRAVWRRGGPAQASPTTREQNGKKKAQHEFECETEEGGRQGKGEVGMEGGAKGRTEGKGEERRKVRGEGKKGGKGRKEGERNGEEMRGRRGENRKEGR